MKPDIADIYSQLGLRPECTLEEFQYAYRRRIAKLHPDRLGGLVSPETERSIRSLNAMHERVCRFHRRFGRMPGAPPRTGPIRIAPPASQVNWPSPYSFEPPRNERSRTTLTLVILFIALIVLVASWSWITSRPHLGTGTPVPPSPALAHRA